MSRTSTVFISIFLCGAMILGGLYYLGRVISEQNFSSSTNFPYELDINTPVQSEFLSEYDAASYACIEINTFGSLLEKGYLDGFFVKYTDIYGNTQYIFSKSKLTAWLNERMETGHM